MRPGQPPDRIRSWVPVLPCHRMAADDRFSPTALPLSRQRRICQSQLPVVILRSIDLKISRSCDQKILRSRTCDCRGGQRPFPARCCLLPRANCAKQGGGGGRNARATSRARARFLECPPAIHPRESPVAAGSAAIIRQAQELSRFAEPTLSQFGAPRNTKNLQPCAETVEEVSSLWKPEEN